MLSDAFRLCANGFLGYEEDDESCRESAFELSVKETKIESMILLLNILSYFCVELTTLNG